METSAVTQVRERLTAVLHSLRNAGWKTPTSLMTAIFGLILLRSWRSTMFTELLQRFRRPSRDSAEPGLFKKNSTFEAFTAASGFTYPRIRIFYQPHPQAAKLPKDIPLLVFMHGLGGNATQFAPLLASLTNIAPCLAIDLPGCGLSDFRPNDPAAYTTKAYAELLYAVIERFRDSDSNQQVVLVGHSMGCSINALLASSTSPLHEKLKAACIIGMVAICPRSGPLSDHEARSVGRLKYMPSTLLDLFRYFDQRGGLRSVSVTRMVGKEADDETRRLQQRYNKQSKSAVFLRSIAGMLPSTTDETSGLPGKDVWSGMKVPLFLVAGDADSVTSPQQVEQIASWLTKSSTAAVPGSEDDVAAISVDQHAKPADEDIAPDDTTADLDTNGAADSLPTTAGDVHMAQQRLSGDATITSDNSQHTTDATDMIKDEQTKTQHAFALKISIFPAPAAHGLMYSTATVRTLSGLTEKFLAQHVDERLTLGWQLQHMTTSGKWDVKNLKKWQSVDPCSEPIAGVFRAMKTMREVDEHHNPKEFAKTFSSSVLPDGVAMIVDISHESPVYDPKGLEEGGVEYHKFPTVSKLPPTPDEVNQFISLIDQLRRSPKVQGKDGEKVHPTIGVHCHYGFNRTGFFIVCYLVERLGYRLQDAIQEFAEKRAPGIKHEHFVNELYVRYAVRMERRGTVIG